jgi:hypothetical protein
VRERERERQRERERGRERGRGRERQTYNHYNPFSKFKLQLFVAMNQLGISYLFKVTKCP